MPTETISPQAVAMKHKQQEYRWIASAPDPRTDAYDADIIILSLDRVDETLAAIDSALFQKGVSTHVFVLDQGSPLETLNRLAAALAGQCAATLFAVGTNLGVAGGR